LLKAFRSMVREGGTLRPALEALGDTAEGLAYIFRDLFFDVNDEWTLKPGIQTVTEQINDWLSQIEQKTADFLTWGGNLIINFAQGMILGANEGILMAIDYINSILDFWFKPGSPPRVSPDIDVYGAMTMNEYFKGFTKADFNILSSLRTPIRNLIKEMFDAEKIGADAANKLYRSLILDLSKAIKSGDFENVLNRLRRTFGDLGYEMSVLARVQLELGEAMNELARAQARLDEANRRLTQSEADVNRVMAEFNLLAKKGASEKVLDQKRKEYYQSIKNRKEARKAVKESEREVETAEERVDKLEEQVAVQKELLETLMDLRKEHFKVKVSLDTSGVSGGIKEIEDSLKSLGREIKGTPGTNKLWADEQEKSPIEQAWDELKKRWEEDIVPIFEEMQTNFETLETTVQPLKDEFREMFRPITEFLEENGDNLTTLIGTLTGVATISGLTTMVVLASSFAVAVRGIGSAWDWYKEKLAESDRKWAVVKQKQKDGLDDLKWFFKDTWDTIASLIKEKLTETDNNWDGSLLRKKTSLITFKFEFQRFLDNMKLRLKIFLYTWTTKWQERIDGALETIQTFGDGAKKVWDAVKDRAVTRFNEIKGKIVEAINKVITLLNKISLINIPTIGWSTGTGGWVPHHASGTNGWENVPQGFPNDSYPIMVESGERYMVQTPAQARAYDAIIAGLVSGASKGSSVYNTRQANYNLTVNTQADVPTVQGGFNMLGAVVGVSP